MKRAWIFIGGTALVFWVVAMSLTYKIQELPTPYCPAFSQKPLCLNRPPLQVTSAHGYETIVATFVPDIGLSRFAGIGIFLLVVSALLLGLAALSFSRFLKSK